ncbi:hypothetical protein EZS27_020657 [termite gut metagenome]|uniref:Uncharacterized protein n=1 Tax=termite gut metagenome TaxID=433724 RepID=A0A5J4RBD4_9ZZZZ
METNLLAKEKVLQILNKLPDQFTIQRLEYEYYLINSIERGLKNSQEGSWYSQEQIKELIDEDKI